MFEKKIKFICHEDYVSANQEQPVPIKTNIPEWFKKLGHGTFQGEDRTVKGCMPFLDTLTTGYLLKVPQDIQIEHNVWNEELQKEDSYYKIGENIFEELIAAKGINLNRKNASLHPASQAEGSPHLKKNSNKNILKLLNPWVIKTPPGYSCLFVPPLNNTDDRFSIIPGIVDTDSFNLEINFPIVLNGDKYKTLKGRVEKGTPDVEVIPCRRDSRKMEVVGLSEKE